MIYFYSKLIKLLVFLKEDDQQFRFFFHSILGCINILSSKTLDILLLCILFCTPL